jgi:hypothetical protein
MPDGFHTAGQHGVHALGHDAARRDGDGLQARGAKRVIVVPAIDSGSPARNTVWRPRLRPWMPSGLPQPRIRSSIISGSMPERSTAALTEKAASWAAG